MAKHRKSGGDTDRDQTVIARHYGLRYVTPQQVQDEIINLLRKSRKGSLDDFAQRLFSALDLSSRYPEESRYLSNSGDSPRRPPRRDIRAGGRYEVNPPLIKPSFGSVSTGTLKDGDLIDAFTSELEHLYRGHRMPPDVKSLVQQGNAFGEDSDQPDDDDLTGDLQNALNDIALPYSYFGSLEGDGADFGFWPDMEQLERAVQDGEVIKVNDTGDIPAKYRGEVMVVNDHGNVTFGYMDGRHRFRELWSVV